ncbi:unnamed protein product [Cylicocyclus nassatus]|uniref:Uncharacterized protein n=1 Tax=Cylicocyclus nassatus TaxID=53992 RepID=A0AA36H3J1_CYLNA|nr:unnamed protein product [Cylicocyclus nassatus]
MDKFTEEERRFMEENLRQEFARKIRMVESSPARPTESIVRQKLKFYADKCYEFESLHKHAKARFVSLMMDSIVHNLLGLYDLLLKEEKAAVEEAECEFKRNTAAEDKTLREMRNAFMDLQDDVKKQQHETREWMQAMHQHFEGLVTREMKDGFRSLREEVKRQQESTMHQIENITAQLQNLSGQVSEEAESRKHELKSQSNSIRSWLDKMESSISSTMSTNEDPHKRHQDKGQHHAQQGEEEDRTSHSGCTRTGSKRRHESPVSEFDRQQANLQRLLDQSEREVSDVEHFLSNCGGIERRFGDREMKDNESLLMCVCKVFGKHYSDACPRIRSVAERLEILREEGRCLNCIELHDALSCRKRPICFYCKRADPSAPPSEHREHHASICTKPEEYTRKVQLRKDLLRRIDRCKEELMNSWRRSASARAQEEKRTPDYQSRPTTPRGPPDFYC